MIFISNFKTKKYFGRFCQMHPSALSAKCLSALMLECFKYSSVGVFSLPKCPCVIWVLSECPSAWVPSESPLSAQRSFKMLLSLRLNKKHSSEIHFKKKKLANSMICFNFCKCNIFQGRQKHLKTFFYINNTLWDFQTISFHGS